MHWDRAVMVLTYSTAMARMVLTYGTAMARMVLTYGIAMAHMVLRHVRHALASPDQCSSVTCGFPPVA